LFQARAAATGKARSPTVESLVRGTSGAAVDVDNNTIPTAIPMFSMSSNTTGLI